MSIKSIPLNYVNDLSYELQKAFWDERGKGARFRMTTVGREYFKNRCLPLVPDTDVESITASIAEILREDGIAASIAYETEERLLKVTVEGCVHRPVEDKMLALDIEPFTCIPANLVVLAIEEKLNRPVELAEIKTEEGKCQLTLILFDQLPVLE